MPAFQSAPLRDNCRLRRRVTVWNINTFHAPFRRGQAPFANDRKLTTKLLLILLGRCTERGSW
ncbi:MAG: hypothetical protein LBQ66_16530 [Planctomycetaceae bacterium]|nr:hypothetical protein [Planctomycetaceae bacterium]